MNPILQKQPAYDVAVGQVARNKVLRNTFWLLALSMIPTVLGAFVGVSMQLPMFSGFMGFIVFMAIAFGFMYAIEKKGTQSTFDFTIPLPIYPILRQGATKW